MDDLTMLLSTIGDLEFTRRKLTLEIQRLTEENAMLKEPKADATGSRSHPKADSSQ